MGIRYHPGRGTIIEVHYGDSSPYQPPEMKKTRLAIVLDRELKTRRGLCSVVPMSLTPPWKEGSVQIFESQREVPPYCMKIVIPFVLNMKWDYNWIGPQQKIRGKKVAFRWLKGDLVSSVALQRCDLLTCDGPRKLNGVPQKRFYCKEKLPEDLMKKVEECVMRGMGLTFSPENLHR